MKKLIAFLASAFLLPSMMMAQAPQAMTYQAVARDNAGNPLANQVISARITIHDATAGGTILYQEVHSPDTTNQFGLFTLQVGRGTAVQGAFSSISWGTNAKYIQVEFDPNGGTNYLNMGTTQLLSVPYALYAASAPGGSDSLILNGNELKINGGNTVTLPSGGGGDNWGTQTVVSNSTLTGNGTIASPLGISQQGANDGQTLKWNGVSWAPANDNNTTYSGGSGISFAGTVVNNNAQTDATLTGNGTVNTPLSIAQQNATSGQVLKWNGTTWMPANDNNTTYTAGTGISIAGGVITNTEPGESVSITGSGATTVTGAYPNFNVSSTDGQTLTFNSGTGLLSISGGNSVTIPSGGSTYTAGSGIAINGSNVISNDAQTDATLNGNGTLTTPLKLAQQSATTGEVLKWNGTSWAPAADNNTTYTAGTNITINGSDVISTPTVTLTGSGGTTVTPGTYPAFTISSPAQVNLTGTGSTTITGTYPNLTINSTSGTTYTAGTGINIAGSVISNTFPEVNLTGSGGTTISGTYPNLTVSSTAPTTYTAGTGISIAGGVITNTEPNQTVSITGTGGTTVTGTYPSFTVTSTAPTTYTAGTGISITGGVIANTFPEVNLTGSGGTTVTGTYPNLTVTSTAPTTYTAGSGITLTGTAFSNDAQTDATLTGIGTTASPLKIAQQSATTGQALEWNGTTWAPATVSSGGGTLNQAYNFGGPSLGRTITMNDSSVQILVPNGKGTLSQGVGLLAKISGGTGDAINAASTIASNGFPAIQASSNSTNTASSAILGDMLGAGVGVAGEVDVTGTGQYGVFGNNLGTNTQATGVYGNTAAPNGAGVYGQNTSSPTGSENGAGVTGVSTGTGGDGVYGDGSVGVEGESSDPVNNIGVGTLASIFAGGNLTALGAKAFTIDHPLDPANKLLRHFSIESPEILNMYRGNVTLDASGEAVVQLPDYFSAINIDFSYNLTPIGDAAPNLHIKDMVKGNTFSIAGGKPGMMVSWAVYAQRHDLYMQANADKEKAEVEKPASKKGTYVAPQLYGQGPDKMYFNLHKSNVAPQPTDKLNAVPATSTSPATTPVNK